MDPLEPPPDAPRVGRVPTEDTRELEGVPVREVAVLAVGFVPSCFVGDLVGDYRHRTQSVTSLHSEGEEQLRTSTNPDKAGWSARSIDRARTWSIETDPPGHLRIWNGGPPRPGSGRHTIRARCCLWALLRRRRRRGLLYDRNGDRPHEHAPAHLAVEVALPLNGAIVLAAIVVELDADPVAGREVRLAHEANSGLATVGQLDDLADFNAGHVGRCGSGRIQTSIPPPYRIALIGGLFIHCRHCGSAKSGLLRLCVEVGDVAFPPELIRVVVRIGANREAPTRGSRELQGHTVSKAHLKQFYCTKTLYNDQWQPQTRFIQFKVNNNPYESLTLKSAYC